MINLINQAILRIPESYYSVTNPADRNGRPTAYTRGRTQPERNFVTQLCTQLYPKLTEPYSLQLDTEIYKSINEPVFRDAKYLDSISTILQNQIGLYPDLIYHRGQYDTHPENQVFALGCKINSWLSQEQFNKDLIKVMMYKHELNFQTVVFLIANNNITKIEEFTKVYESQYYINRDHLYIIVVEKYGSVPACLIHGQGNRK